MIKTVTTYVNEDGFEFRCHPIEETLKVKKVKGGYVAKYLVQDDMVEMEDDDSVFLVNYHSDFDVRKDEVITEDDVRAWYQGEEIEQAVNYFIFELSCLIHGGVWLSLDRSFISDPGGWDTSHVGVVCVSMKEAKTREKALKLAEGLIETWNQYLSNDVYCIVREKYDKDKKPIDYDVVGGYFGHEYALKELESFEGFG
jgi:hypothetical protein